MLSNPYIARHALPNKRLPLTTRVQRLCKRYHRAHKPTHIFCVLVFFALEITALIIHAHFVIHAGISAGIATWETMVIALAEEE